MDFLQKVEFLHKLLLDIFLFDFIDLLKSRDLLVVLDEKGIHMSSEKYAFFLNDKLHYYLHKIFGYE